MKQAQGELPVKTIDDYLAKLPEAQRTALEKLRHTILDAAPEATELISYQVPAFKYEGMLVGMGAAKNHCAFYIMSTAVIAAFKEELAAYDTSPGTIRFQPEKPLPVVLVKKLVKARIKENKAMAAAKQAKKKTK